MANDGKVVLVTGATGKQGGAVIRHLAGSGFKLKAMTRKKDSEPARALASKGIEIVVADLDDPSSLERVLAGAWGVFAVQNTWEAGVEREEEQGKRLARLAKEKGVQHFVYSSVGSAHRRTGIPHFENKFRVEEEVRRLGFPSFVIIRPVFFMENLTSPWFLQGDKLAAAMKPETRLQMIAVDDVGRVGALAFSRSGQLNRKELDIAGDAATMPEAAGVLSEVLRRRIEFVRLPIEEVRKNSADFAAMLEWFDRVGYNADVSGTEKELGFRFTRLKDWAHRAASGSA